MLPCRNDLKNKDRECNCENDCYGAALNYLSESDSSDEEAMDLDSIGGNQSGDDSSSGDQLEIGPSGDN